VTWLLALLGLLTAVPLGLALGDVWPAWTRQATAPWFGAGALGGAALGWLLVRQLPLLPILEHEMTHLLTALALFRRPRQLLAADGGGEVVYDGRGSTLIRLAPYAVPTLTLLALPFAPLVAVAQRPWFVALLGLTWGYHALTSLHETRPHQPDLRQGGLVPSFVAVAAIGTVLFGATALAAVGRTPLVERWLQFGLQRARGLLSLLG
jgi:hypothetical protein